MTTNKITLNEVIEELNTNINLVFYNIQQEHGIKNGDISPEVFFTLYEKSEDLAKVILEALNNQK